MEVRHGIHQDHFKHMTTEEIRKHMLVQNIFTQDKISLVYSHIDRIIVGGAKPVKDKLKLEAGKEIGAEFFLARRELGIINVGGKGIVSVDGSDYELNTQDGLYVGMGSKEVIFSSSDKNNPAKFYFNSTPAHVTYPIVKVTIDKANPRQLGSPEQSNLRTIYQYIHPAVLKSCQLVMGLTILAPNNMWNSMPCHTHDRRMEVYFYFNLTDDSAVFHMVGEPSETRHVVIRNEEAVIMPSWSIHTGVGTRNYTFIWGMAGENQTFDDMDHVAMTTLK